MRKTSAPIASDATTVKIASAAKKQEENDRSDVAKKWLAYEAKLVDKAVDLFKQRCVREAEQQKTEVTVSFEVLTRDIPNFPKRILTDSTYYVDQWGEDVSAEAWHYAVRGSSAGYQADQPVLFAEVLEGMMPKFVSKLQSPDIGFKSCSRDPGTWKVQASWIAPKEDHEENGERKKDRKRSRSRSRDRRRRA